MKKITIVLTFVLQHLKNSSSISMCSFLERMMEGGRGRIRNNKIAAASRESVILMNMGYGTKLLSRIT
jgi:hypothetical protein